MVMKSIYCAAMAEGDARMRAAMIMDQVNMYEKWSDTFLILAIVFIALSVVVFCAMRFPYSFCVLTGIRARSEIRTFEKQAGKTTKKTFNKRKNDNIHHTIPVKRSAAFVIDEAISTDNMAYCGEPGTLRLQDARRQAL